MNTPRDAVISAHIDAALHHTRLSFETYAQGVVDHYHANVPDTMRAVKFHPVPRTDPYPAMRANAQIVRRMHDGTVRMPVEIEESMIQALPKVNRDACLRELVRRMGFVAAEIPASDARGQVMQMARLMRGAGSTINALAPMFEDGAITAADAGHAPAALAQLEGLLADISTVALMVRTIIDPSLVAHSARSEA